MSLLRNLKSALGEWWRWAVTKEGWTLIESKPTEAYPHRLGADSGVIYIETWRNDTTGEIRYDQLWV